MSNLYVLYNPPTYRSLISGRRGQYHWPGLSQDVDPGTEWRDLLFLCRVRCLGVLDDM